jgi:hypothetical protein
METSGGPANQGINWKVKSYQSRSRGTFAVRLAQRLTTILPAMTLAAAMETRRINRVADLTGGRTAFVTRHPCGAPAINNMLEVNHAKVKRALSQIGSGKGAILSEEQGHRGRGVHSCYRRTQIACHSRAARGESPSA